MDAVAKLRPPLPFPPLQVTAAAAACATISASPLLLPHVRLSRLNSIGEQQPAPEIQEE